VVLSVDDLQFCYKESKQLLDDSRCLHRQLCRHLYKKERNDDGMTGRIHIEVPQRFRLRKTFKKWYQSGDKDITYLMRSLNKSDRGKPDHYHVSRFFQPWIVEYGGTFVCLRALFV
jgi:hypothetical protein